MNDAAVLDLPTTRDEAWRWADLDSLRTAAATPAVPVQGVNASALFLDVPGPKLFFLDGVFQSSASAREGVGIGPVAATSAHPLAAQATGNGWSLELAADRATGLVQVVHFASAGTSHMPARIALAAGAQAEIVETFVGLNGWTNRLTAIELGHGARLMRSVRLHQGAGFVSLREEARLGAGASLVSVFLGTGASGSRIDGDLRLEGEGAYAEMGGALLTRGTQRQECAVAVHHAAPAGQSHQLWRAVAADQSVASLAARVEVARHAQKTDGEQSLRGLLLQRTAAVNLKPELEIFADDVKCAHGATVGELDRRALFYMETRGIPAARAKALLTRAFVADALDRIASEGVRGRFATAADEWLEQAL